MFLIRNKVPESDQTLLYLLKNSSLWYCDNIDLLLTIKTKPTESPILILSALMNVVTLCFRRERNRREIPLPTNLPYSKKMGHSLMSFEALMLGYSTVELA